MIELPATLAPWAPHLGMLAPDLAVAIAPWLGRLAVALGPLTSSRADAAGEPDGYRGLARRGSYERLVASEWALADLFPDEFLRRAATGEHLFTDLARRAPSAALRTVALVSAGPSQLGAPRLAHLVALVVLVRRAAAAGAAFAWGVLEDPRAQLSEGLDEAGLRRLLAARTAQPLDATALDAWAPVLGAKDRARDVWLIGGPELAALPTASRLVVRDVIATAERALDVDVIARRGTVRLRLPLPTADVCVRLLREPLSASAPTPRASSAGRARRLWFANGGGRLLVERDDGGIENWAVPGSPRANLPPPNLLRVAAHEQVVAIGTHRRGTLAIVAYRDERGHLTLGVARKHQRVLPITVPADLRLALEHALAVPGGVPVGLCGIAKVRAGAAELVIHLLETVLVVRGFLPPAPTLEAEWLRPGGLAGPAVVGFAFVRQHALWVEQMPGGAVRVIEATPAGQRHHATVNAATPADVHIGFVHPAAPTWGAVSVARGPRERTIVLGRSSHPAVTAEAAAVDPIVGVCQDAEAAALVVKSRADALALHRGDTVKPIATASGAITQVAVATEQAYVAWVTERGEAVVWSLAHKVPLLTREPHGGR